MALAILANKDISTSSIDLMACAFSLQSLFLFTRGARKTFRIMVKAVEGTVFLIRREGSPSEVIPNVRGYGHSMPEAYTTWHHDIKGSVSNQRVIRYTFAGLDCLLRYEPDGYLPDKLDPDVLALMTQDSEIVPTTADIALEVQMQDAKLTSSQVQPAEADLHVEKAGIHIPQAATFELKTRSFKRKEEHFFEEFALRLWLTQTPYFILAFHTYGSFDDIRIRDVRSDVAIWESKNQPDIKRFAGLLQQIVRRARAESGGTLELWRHESGDLEVRKPPGELYGALPLDLEDLWVEDSEGGIAVH